jgi:hypothetical protein
MLSTSIMNEKEAESMLAQLQLGRSKGARVEPNERDDLDQRIVETMSWCTQHSILKRTRRCLRPARIAPPPLPINRWKAVETVISARRALIKVTGEVTINDMSGRLLVYFPDLNLADGAAEVASQDFFDVHNAPPCGTWIGYFEDGGSDPSRSSYLLAWIPQVFLDVARHGVEANPEKCIVWLSDTQLALRYILKHLRIGRNLP